MSRTPDSTVRRVREPGVRLTHDAPGGVPETTR